MRAAGIGMDPVPGAYARTLLYQPFFMRVISHLTQGQVKPGVISNGQAPYPASWPIAEDLSLHSDTIQTPHIL